MSNRVGKQNEFDATTRVMESGLLRTLTDQSSAPDDETRASAERAPRTAAPPPAATTGTGQPEVAPEPPARGSRLFVVAGIVTAVVLACDASLFTMHQRRARRPAAAAAQAPMPRYVLLPPGSAPAAMPAAAIAPPAVTPPASTPPVAAAVPDASATATREHRHSHHHHAGR